MAKPQEKLADSLSVLENLQKNGNKVVHTSDLSRIHRERLLKNGFLKQVIKGWYIPSHPREVEGESTAWYTSFWDFCTVYLNRRFGEEWCLSPEPSVLLHVGNNSVPNQLLVRSPKARNRITELPFNTSILDTQAALPETKQREYKEGLKLFSLVSALVSCSTGFFSTYPTDARSALTVVDDVSDILAILLTGGHTVVAGRLAGAFRNVGQSLIADNIIETMKAAGYDVREKDPFNETVNLEIFSYRLSPYVNRIKLMWYYMCDAVRDSFPNLPVRNVKPAEYLEKADEMYVTDAYHSLSIEGYKVTPVLIDKVRSGDWNPLQNKGDLDLRNALSARGYWQAYQVVRESLKKVLEGQNPGLVAADDHRNWYREMFAPSVQAGLLKPEDLAGYRNSQVYIRHSMHIPLRYEAVRDCMPVFFELLSEEPDPNVRIVLGHFVFVYIHPYMDGNGRIARFLMNLMNAAAGYPWTVVPLQTREMYRASQEQASFDQNIRPFAAFLGDLFKKCLDYSTSRNT